MFDEETRKLMVNSAAVSAVLAGIAVASRPVQILGTTAAVWASTAGLAATSLLAFNTDYNNNWWTRSLAVYAPASAALGNAAAYALGRSSALIVRTHFGLNAAGIAALAGIIAVPILFKLTMLEPKDIYRGRMIGTNVDSSHQAAATSTSTISHTISDAVASLHSAGVSISQSVRSFGDEAMKLASFAQGSPAIAHSV